MTETYQIANPQITSETIDGEVIIINLENGNYYSMEGIGTLIWDSLKENNPKRKIIEKIQNEYSGKREEIQASLDSLLEELLAESLVAPTQMENQSTVPNEIQPANRSLGEKPAFTPPVLNIYSDMKDLLLLDPIHDVDEGGWPLTKANP